MKVPILHLQLRKRGYVSQTHRLVPGADQVVHVELAKGRARARVRPTSTEVSPAAGHKERRIRKLGRIKSLGRAP